MSPPFSVIFCSRCSSWPNLLSDQPRGCCPCNDITGASEGRMRSAMMTGVPDSDCVLAQRSYGGDRRPVSMPCPYTAANEERTREPQSTGDLVAAGVACTIAKQGRRMIMEPGLGPDGAILLRTCSISISRRHVHRTTAIRGRVANPEPSVIVTDFNAGLVESSINHPAPDQLDPACASPPVRGAHRRALFAEPDSCNRTYRIGWRPSGQNGDPPRLRAGN